MLDEAVASTILTASITGAGLVIAFYALITPISSKIFKERVELQRKMKEYFEKRKKEISFESSDKDFKQLKKLASEIKQTGTLPTYLGLGVLLVFSGYIFSAIFSLLWLTSVPQAREAFPEFIITMGFAMSTAGFFTLGFPAIADVHHAMKSEFEQMKKQREEVEKMTKELEEIRKTLKEKKAARIKKEEQDSKVL